MTAAALIVVLVVASTGNLLSRDGVQPDIRDGWLKAVGYLAGIGVGLIEPGLAVLWITMIWRWRGVRDLPELVLWAAGIAAYTAAVATGKEGGAAPVLRAFWVLGVVNIAWALVQLWHVWRAGVSMHTGRNAVYGFLGNRVILGAWSLMALVLAPPLWAPVFVLGIALSTSWNVIAALVVIGLWRWPHLWWAAVLVSAVGLAFLHRYRGHPRDGFAERTRIWGLLLRAWLLGGDGRRIVFGLGRGGVQRYSGWWQAKEYTGLHFAQAHNDLVHFAFEYGLIGLLAVALWAGHVAMHLQVGDGLSAAVLVLAWMALGYFPFHLPQTAIVAVVLVGLLVGR